MLVHHFTAKIFLLFSLMLEKKMKVFLFCSLHSVFFCWNFFEHARSLVQAKKRARTKRWPTFVSRVVRQTRASDTRVRSDKTSRAYLHVISAPWVTSSMWESQTFELCSVKKTWKCAIEQYNAAGRKFHSFCRLSSHFLARETKPDRSPIIEDREKSM